MANESMVLSVTKTNPVRFDQDVTIVTTGGTLTGGNLLEVKFLKANFTAYASGDDPTNGKQDVVNALYAIIAKLQKSDYPLTTYTPS